MFSKRTAQAVPEWLVGVIIAVAVGALVIYAVVDNAATEGSNAADAIDSLNAPATIP